MGKKKRSETVKAGTATIDADIRTIEVPMAQIKPAGFGIHIDFQLNPESSDAIRSLRKALDDGNVRLKNGRRITNTTDSVRWLVEQVALRHADLRVAHHQ